jgi:signal transduction histidine kinase/CheY-like chemotaxis protein
MEAHAQTPIPPGRVGVRSQLVWLVVSAMLPVLIFAAMLVVLFARQEQSAIEQRMRETARALSAAVDQELQSALRALEMLATSTHLETGRLADFHQQADRVRAMQPGWHGVALASPAGRLHRPLTMPSGETLPSVAGRPCFEQVLELLQPAVSQMKGGLQPGGPVMMACVPVIRDAGLMSVVIATFDLPELVDMLARQRLPPGGALRIFDREHATVAGFPIDEGAIGQPASSLTVTPLTTEGWVRSISSHGRPLYAALARAPTSGWNVSLLVPAGVVEGPVQRSLGRMVSTGLMFMAAAALLAAIIGRGISRPLVSLSAAADALGRGADFPALAPSRLREVSDLAWALARSRTLLDERDALRTRLEDALRRRAEELDAANRTKDEFLATVSHELRAPLNAILGWARVARATLRDESSLLRALDTVERNARVQGQLIEDLLDVSRITAGKLRLDVRPTDIVPALHGALDVVGPAAEAKGIAMLTEIDPTAGPVRADPDRLQQVFWNLLSNAIKFTPAGGQVEVRLDRIHGHARLRVSDTGQGISPDFLSHVFERFRQAERRSGAARQGLGLGLSIVRHLVELHGGTVRADSAGEGQGALFTVMLPLMAVRMPLVTDPARSGADLPTLAGVRVLVVEDEEDARDLLHQVLSCRGADVSTTGSAEEAMAALERQRPDILISDLMMPGEDGYSLIRRVRAWESGHGGHIPAVALTGQTRGEDRTRALLAGFEIHFPKPVDAADLIAAVASRVDRRTPPERRCH